MTFAVIEPSNYDGIPILLYEFRRVSGLVTAYWRYTSADEDIVLGVDTYKSVAISDGGITQSAEAPASAFQITMPVVEDIVQMFNNSVYVPSDELFLYVRRLHAGDTDAAIVWVGNVTSVNQISEVAGRITGQTLSTSFQKPGLRLGYSRECPYSVYDKQCSLNPELFKVDGVVSDVNGDVIAALEWAAPLVADPTIFDGGFIKWVRGDGLTEKRGIISANTDELTILGLPIGLSAGMTVSAYPGCQRFRQICQDRFDNLTNYGGFAHEPGKSPFDGDPVF